MAKKSKLQSAIILGLIVLIATVLRFWRLSDYPSGFHIDEATLGYNAYSLLKTARDENGNFLPLHTDMFGDFRPAGYRYFDILPIKLFGLNEFATRFPSAALGTISIVAIFLLTNVIFDDYFVAVICAGLMAISPWHIIFSRSAAETNVELFFTILGTYIFLSGIILGKTRRFFFTVTIWGMALLTYHSSRVFVPILAVSLMVLLYPLWRKQKAILKYQHYFSVLLIVSLALFLVFGIVGGTGRFTQVSIFHFPEIRLVLEEQLREDGGGKFPLLISRIFHNKIVNYGFGYLKEYFSYFSPNFLFIEGGLPLWYKVPGVGLMYLVEMPFFLAGLFLLVKQAKKRLPLVPIIWLILGPMVAASTRDDVPNVLRSLIMLPALVMITGYGLWQCFAWAKHNLKLKIYYLLCLFLGLMFFWNFSYFLHQYFVHAKLHRPWYRSNGFKEMVLAVKKLSPYYDKIIVSKAAGGIYTHFLFFMPIEPVDYQTWGSPRDKDYGGFSKLIFVPDECVVNLNMVGPIKPETKILRVSVGKCNEPPFTTDSVLTIKREDGTPAFLIYPGE